MKLAETIVTPKVVIKSSRIFLSIESLVLCNVLNIESANRRESSVDL